MSVVAKYDWANESFTESADGNSAARSWFVDGTTRCDEAFNAQPQAGDPSIARVNESHPIFQAMRVRNRTVARLQLNSWKVTASYGIPPSGGTYPDDSTPPEQRNPRVLWRSGEISIPTSIDAYGVALVTSVGDALDPPPQRALKLKYLTVTRWEAGYDYATYAPFEGSVNSKPIKLSNKVTLAPGDMLCDTIAPAEEFELLPNAQTDVIIPIAYNFRIIQDFYYDDKNRYKINWPWRLLSSYQDVGLTAWVTINSVKKKGKLFYSDGTNSQECTTPQAYDGSGRPLDTNLNIHIDDTHTGTPEVAPEQFFPPTYIGEFSKRGKVRVIGPRMQREEDLGQLAIFR